jgi:hypothetical protein
MEAEFKVKFALALCLGLPASLMFGHDVPVHRAITINAAESAMNGSPAYSNFVDVISSDLPYTGAPILWR